jgi:hypothetical protein
MIEFGGFAREVDLVMSDECDRRNDVHMGEVDDLEEIVSGMLGDDLEIDVNLSTAAGAVGTVKSGQMEARD